LSLRRFFTAATIYTAVATFGKAVNFLLVPFFTHVIPPDEFGVFSALFPFYGVMLMVFQYGMPSAIIKFYIEAKDAAEKQTFVSTLLAMQTASSFALSAAMSLGAPLLSIAFTGVSDYAGSIVLISVSLFVETLGFNLLWLIRSDNRLGLFSFISVASLFINMGLSVWLVQGGDYVFNLFLAQVAAVLFTFGIALLSNISLIKFQFDKSLAQKLWRFGYPLLGYGVLAVLLDSLDKILVTRFVSKEAGGIYSVGYRLGMAMSILNASFRTALLPFFSQRQETHSQAENHAVFVQIFSLYTTGLTLIFVALSFFVRDIMTLELFGFTLFKDTYLPAASLTPIVLLAYLVAAPTEFSKATLIKSGETGVLLNAVVWSLAINLALIFLALWIRPVDTILTLQLVALATVAAYTFNAIYFRHKSRALDAAPYPIARFFILVGISIGGVFLNETRFSLFPTWQRALICAALMAILTLIGLKPVFDLRRK
jgi:O-antigen/teichoic acid export membrane protein